MTGEVKVILRKQKESFAKGSFIIRWDMLWHLYIANRRGRNKEGRAKEVKIYWWELYKTGRTLIVFLAKRKGMRGEQGVHKKMMKAVC